jgi:hypothetical protein
MINDSGIEIEKEFLDSFLSESFEVLTSLKDLLSNFSTEDDSHLFETFGQNVDRIMEAAFTLSLNELGELSRTGKELGYKAGQVKEMPKLLSIQSLLSQLVKSLEEILIKMKKGHTPDFALYHPLLHKLKQASIYLGDQRISAKV